MTAEQRIDIPENVDVDVDESTHTITVSGDGTELERSVDNPAVSVTTEDGEIVVHTDSKKRNHKAVVGTYASHIQNMIDGVTHGYEYQMKGFYAHFPMDMAVQGDTFIIKNFIGERAPREIPIPDGVDINIADEDVIITGADKEQVGQTAANIEQACYKGDRDPRKFQDGIYITERGVAADE